MNVQGRLNLNSSEYCILHWLTILLKYREFDIPSGLALDAKEYLLANFAVYDLNYDIAAFFELFIKSGVAAQFETGDFTLLAGMSGVELTYEVLEQSGVPLRTIQQYEQRRKDINKAQAEYLVMFAKVLCCRVEYLIEH